MANRLAGAASPYLEQHKDNPVDWWPWSPEAFAQARERDVPVFISIGYAACHWCHVMAHESFEDPTVAEALNSSMVSIKVDREERPDIDAVYLAATQAMTGQGGWPMTVFATPDGEPFFCGTYFPRDTFLQLVRAIATAWSTRREDVVRQGGAVVRAVARAQGVNLDRARAPMTPGLLDSAAATLRDEHDQVHGGFGAAPKFPPHMAMLFLLRHYQRTGDAASLEVARHAAEAMARGGIYDQLAGGFARYSVDEKWIIPHFEKMLYDNALLLRAYTLLWRLTGDPLAARVATETAEFLARDLRTPEGGFASSLDADANGVEGLTYVWTPTQLREVLGDEDGAFAADLFGVTPEGTFEHGASVLRLCRDIDAADPVLVDRWQSVRRRLADARSRRPQPGRDDKVVAAWNGLAITALAEAEACGLKVAEAAGVARSAAELLLRVHEADGRLSRVSRGGVAGPHAGVLDDYGCVAEAFCAMHQVTGSGHWLDAAKRVLDAALAHFGNGEGGFYDTADDAEQLVARPSDPTDTATPSGLSAMAAALTAYAALTGETRYREAAVRALESIGELARRLPRIAGYALATAEALTSGPYEIAIVADRTDPLVLAAWRHAPPGAVVVAGPSDSPGVPLLSGRRMIDDRPTAYVCRGFVCDRPVTTVDDLVSLLAAA